MYSDFSVRAAAFAVALLLFGGASAGAPQTSEELRSLVEEAQTAENQNRLDEAVSLYKQILRIRPGWASAELNLGLVHHSRGEFDAAIRTLSDALRHQPNLHSALLFRASSYQQIDRPTEAIRDVNEYLRHQPDDAEALPILAAAWLSKGEPLHAATSFAALARVTGAAGAYFRLSDSYARAAGQLIQRLPEDVANRFRQALRDDGDTDCQMKGDAKLSGARCAAARGDFERATRTLIGVVGRYQSDAESADRLARTFTWLARSAAAKVFSADPNSGWAALLRAQAAEEAGQSSTAAEEYRKAVAWSGATSEMYVRYGQYLCSQSAFEECLVRYERALEMDPSTPGIMGLVGEVHLMQNRPERAIEYLRKAVAASPRETRVRLYLAQALNQAGRVADAIQVLEAAPEDPDGRLHFALGRTYMQQGQPEKAKRAMDIFRQRRGTVRQ